MIHKALGEAGGVKYLTRMAEEQPRAFLALLGRLIPSEVKAQVEGSGIPRLIFRDYTGRGRHGEPKASS